MTALARRGLRRASRASVMARSRRRPTGSRCGTRHSTRRASTCRTSVESRTSMPSTGCSAAPSASPSMRAASAATASGPSTCRRCRQSTPKVRALPAPIRTATRPATMASRARRWIWSRPTVSRWPRHCTAACRTRARPTGGDGTLTRPTRLGLRGEHERAANGVVRAGRGQHDQHECALSCRGLLPGGPYHRPARGRAYDTVAGWSRGGDGCPIRRGAARAHDAAALPGDGGGGQPLGWRRLVGLMA